MIEGGFESRRAWMSLVSVVGRDLQRADHSSSVYRVWRVIVRDLETSVMNFGLLRRERIGYEMLIDGLHRLLCGS